MHDILPITDLSRALFRCGGTAMEYQAMGIYLLD